MSDIEDIKLALVNLPKDMKMHQGNILSANRKISQLEKETKRIEGYTTYKVSQEEADGKKKYTNEGARKAATQAQLEADDEYQSFLKQIEEAKDKLQENTVEFDYLRREFRAIGMMLDIMKMED